MVDFGITGVWCNSPEEFRLEFKKEFNLATEDERDGLHTYVFCQYHDASVYAEVVYVLIKGHTVLFFLNTTQYELSLDEKFKVRSFHTNDDTAYMFLSSVFAYSDVEFIDECCSDQGAYYRVFSLNNPNQVIKVKSYNGQYPLEDIIPLNDDIVMDISCDFMEFKSKQFANEIDKAKRDDEPFEGLEENPFQDKFFDRFENETEEAPKVYE